MAPFYVLTMKESLRASHGVHWGRKLQRVVSHFRLFTYLKEGIVAHLTTLMYKESSAPIALLDTVCLHWRCLQAVEFSFLENHSELKYTCSKKTLHCKLMVEQQNKRNGDDLFAFIRIKLHHSRNSDTAVERIVKLVF